MRKTDLMQTNKNPQRKKVSILIPAYNEEAILHSNLEQIYTYMSGLEKEYDWDMLLVDDGSSDRSPELADAFAASHPKMRVVHHVVNMNLGNALKTGFAQIESDYIITMDLDLSYSVDHIGRLLQTLESTRAEIVIASPYMKGGRVTAVPFGRKVMSRTVNRFMRLAAQEKYYTYTGMVRGYQTEFIRNLNLKTKDYEINPEILYKAMILRARIVEIPAHLDWTEQNKHAGKRKSGLKVFRGFLSGLMSSFIFRPYIFFLGVGTFFLFLSLYIIGWIFYNVSKVAPQLQIDPQHFDDRFSMAVGVVFNERPHAFFVGGFSLLVALQILSLGFLALQSKRYFEELFHINTNILLRGK